MTNSAQRTPWALIGLLALVLATALTVLLGVPRFAQDPGYHAWVDQRVWFGLPNAANVVSNLGFALVGLAGCLRIWSGRVRFIDGTERLPYLVFFGALACVAPGSAWYHLSPANDTLFWDRLPMSLAFMALLAAVVSDRVGVTAGRRALPWLAALGPASVVYWIASEAAGTGDLRAYVFVQVMALALIPLLLAVTPGRYTRGSDLLVSLAFYAAAMVCERLDAIIFEASGWISGHTLKHLLATVAVAGLWRMLELRRPAPAPAHQDH